MSFKPIFVAISFSLALFLLLFVVRPKYQDLNKVNREINRVQSKVEKSKDYVSDLKELSKQLDQNRKGVRKIESALPSEPKIPSLLNFLSVSAEDEGLLMKNVSGISQSSYKNNINKTNISITLSGSYSSFKRLLKVIEKSSRIIEVENIGFSMPKEDDKASPEYNINLSTFYYTSS